MPLDLGKIDIVRESDGCYYGRCPACAELGEDRKKQHLVIFETGAYFCCKYGDDEEHKKRIWQLAGLNSRFRGLPVIARPLVVKRKPNPSVVPGLLKLKPLQERECRRLCLTRGWSLDAMPGLFELGQRGLLRIAELWENELWHDAWVIKDSSLVSAQAKKLYGGSWACGKVKSLYGSCGSWTIGAPDIGARPIVILCEGMPDFVAALGIAYLEGVPMEAVAPVCIAGAGHRIHPNALPCFAKKRVRIFAHPDEAGQKAARVWATQLFSVQADVSQFTFSCITRKDGVPIKDMADYLTLLDDENEPPGYILRDLWSQEISDQIDRWSP